MKLISWYVTQTPFSFKTFFSTPYFSTRSLKFSPKDPSQISIKLACSGLATFGIWILALQMKPISYLDRIFLAPFIYVVIEFLGSLGQLSFLWSKIPTFPVHSQPIFSQNLSEFWGRRWNLWVQDWLKDMSYFQDNKKTKHKIIITFLISGLFHELMVNLPYWIFFQKSYFGSMMLYFLIQAIGIWLDKIYVRKISKLTRRLFLWLWVLIPVPLFINMPILTFFGLN